MCAVLNCRMWALGWVEVCKKNFLCGWLGWGHILPYRQGRHVAMALQAELAAGADVNLGIAVSSLQNPAKVCSGVWRFPWCLIWGFDDGFDFCSILQSVAGWEFILLTEHFFCKLSERKQSAAKICCASCWVRKLGFCGQMWIVLKLGI